MISRDEFEKFRAFLLAMARLNSENFSKFFLCSDDLLLTCSYERAHPDVQKNRFFPNILEYS